MAAPVIVSADFIEDSVGVRARLNGPGATHVVLPVGQLESFLSTINHLRARINSLESADGRTILSDLRKSIQRALEDAQEAMDA